ncbi:hypothetical protein ACFLTW_01600 [Chloroflexota bacterium]
MTDEISSQYIWSDWYCYNDETMLVNLPDNSGIYEVRTDFEIGRLQGSSSIVTIGRAKNLKERRCQKVADPIRYLNRAEKWLLQYSHVLEFHYCVCSNFEEAKYKEVIRQLEYEGQHWELPPGNDRLETTPLNKIILDIFGMSKEKLAEELFHGRLEAIQVAKCLQVPMDIINNFVVYWGK